MIDGKFWVVISNEKGSECFCEVCQYPVTGVYAMCYDPIMWHETNYRSFPGRIICMDCYEKHYGSST